MKMPPSDKAMAAARKMFTVIDDPNHSTACDVYLHGQYLLNETNGAEAHITIEPHVLSIAHALDAFAAQAVADEREECAEMVGTKFRSAVACDAEEAAEAFLEAFEAIRARGTP